MVGLGRELEWELDPLDLLAGWPEERRAVLLHSGRFHPRWARFSLFAEPVGVYRFCAGPRGGRSSWHGPADQCPVATFAHRPFVDLRRLLSATPALLVGHLGYDLGRWIEQALGGPPADHGDRDWPIIELGICPGYLVHDTGTGKWRACGTWADRPDPILTPATADVPAPAGTPRSVFDRPTYERAVAHILEYVAAGDVFQVNLAQRFTAPFDGDRPQAARSLFQRLARRSPAWYGAFLELDGKRAIASTSPELFLSVADGGLVTTRPIKGTRPASVDAEILRDSAKDTAELNMIVDLERNDLGRVCAYGSIAVPEPRVIESHPTIHHGVATIRGRLHQGRDVVDLLRATMPGGSVTGAPKIRAMQIIAELEPVARGPYCGAIGFLSARGSCLNIAIRTMLIDRGRGLVDYSVGGGIVADSQPADEYEETLHKAQAMLGALEGTVRT